MYLLAVSVVGSKEALTGAIKDAPQAATVNRTIPSADSVRGMIRFVHVDDPVWTALLCLSHKLRLRRQKFPATIPDATRPHPFRVQLDFLSSGWRVIPFGGLVDARKHLPTSIIGTNSREATGQLISFLVSHNIFNHKYLRRLTWNA